jgi:hypothetical protein
MEIRLEKEMEQWKEHSMEIGLGKEMEQWKEHSMEIRLEQEMEPCSLQFYQEVNIEIR